MAGDSAQRDGSLMTRPTTRLLPEDEEGLNRTIFEASPDGMIISEAESGVVVEANLAACRMHGYTRQEFCGLRPTDYIHPDSQTQFYANIEAFRSGIVIDSPALHVRQDGSTFHAEWRWAAIIYQGQPCLLGVIRDVSRRVKSEHQLQQRLGVRANENAILLEISQILASTLEFEPGLILDQLRVLIQYTHASLFVLEDTTLVAVAVRGAKRLEESVPFRVPLDSQRVPPVMFEGRNPIRIADVWGSEPAAEALRSLLVDHPGGLLEDIHSWMWVPLAVKNRVIGGIGLARTDSDYFTPHLAGLAMTIANQAAVTMANADLYERAQALATLQERQRLARSLHDAVNQSLFSAGLIAEVLPRLWEQDTEEARTALKDLRRLTRGAQAEMRALLAELRPTTLTDTDLGDLLDLLGKAFTGRTNIPVTVNVGVEGQLSTDIQIALYQICQEALFNIGKHAKASQVEIDVLPGADGPELRIRDNGRGFETSERTPSGHYGLSMMRERAQAVGADLKVQSQVDQGTTVSVRWEKKEKS